MQRQTQYSPQITEVKLDVIMSKENDCEVICSQKSKERNNPLQGPSTIAMIYQILCRPQKWPAKTN